MKKEQTLKTLTMLVLAIIALSFSSCFNSFTQNYEDGTLLITTDSPNRCNYPSTDGLTYKAVLTDTTNTKTIYEYELTGSNGSYSCSNIPYGTYSLTVKGYNGTVEVLSGTSESTVTISGTVISAAVALTWNSDSTTAGYATLSVTLNSTKELDTSTGVTATFTNLSTSTTTTFSSLPTSSASGTTTATSDSGTTATTVDGTTTATLSFTKGTSTSLLYTYTIANIEATSISLTPGTYNLSLLYNEKDLLATEDYSVVIVPGMTTSLTYGYATYGYKKIWVDYTSSVTSPSGTILAPYATITKALESLTDNTECIEITLLNPSTDSASPTSIEGIAFDSTMPVVLNCREGYLSFYNLSSGFNTLADSNLFVIKNSKGAYLNVLSFSTSNIEFVDSTVTLGSGTEVGGNLTAISSTITTSTSFTVGGNLTLTDSSIAYSSTDSTSTSSAKVLDLTGSLYTSETTAGSTFISGGFISLGENSTISVDSALTATTVATVRPYISSASLTSKAIFATTDNVTLEQWPLHNTTLMAYDTTSYAVTPTLTAMTLSSSAANEVWITAYNSTYYQWSTNCYTYPTLSTTATGATEATSVQTTEDDSTFTITNDSLSLSYSSFDDCVTTGTYTISEFLYNDIRLADKITYTTTLTFLELNAVTSTYKATSDAYPLGTTLSGSINSDYTGVTISTLGTPTYTRNYISSAEGAKAVDATSATASTAYSLTPEATGTYTLSIIATIDSDSVTIPTNTFTISAAEVVSIAFDQTDYSYLLPDSGSWYTVSGTTLTACTPTWTAPTWTAPTYTETYTDSTTKAGVSSTIAAPTAIGATTGTATVTSNQGDASATCNITTYGTTTPTFTSTGASKDENEEFNVQDAIAYTATVDTTYLPTSTGRTLSYTWSYTIDSGTDVTSLSSAATSDLSFTPTVAGTYSFTLAVSNIVVGSTTYSLTLATPLTFTVHSGSSSVTLSTPTNQTVTLAGTLADAAIADTTTLAYTDTASALVLTATCATAATDATYTWYVNGTAVTITDNDGSEATLTTTPSAFADAASSVINIDGANTVTVTITESSIIVGRATMTLTYGL